MKYVPGLLAFAAGCAPAIDGQIETHTLNAENVDQLYTLYVFVPDAASEASSVVYLFDGDDWTEDTAGIVSELARAEGVTPPLVVGIGYGDTPNARGRDYTPPGYGIPDNHGEVEAFYRFLVDELVPWVDDAYDTAPSAEARVVMGHSFGGIAALWAPLFAGDTFGGSVSLSPSLAFADAAFFTYEADFAESNDDMAARLYLGAGALEAHGLAGLTEAFGAQLGSRSYPSLALQTELIPRRVHNDVFPDAAEAGLRFVLGAP